MLKFNSKSIRAVARLFRPYNDIDVYVEDITGRGVYEAIVNRILEGEAVVKRVIQVGDKQQVLSLWENDNEEERPSLYIVDGDFDIHFNEKRFGDNLYQLNCYCLENLLYCQDSICQIAYESDPESFKEEVLQRLDINELEQVVNENLVPLFMAYAVVNKLNDDIQTTGYSVWRLSKTSKQLSICGNKVDARIDEIFAQIYGFDEDIIEAKVEEVENVVFGMGYPLDFYVSAKDYILPVVYNKLQDVVKYSGTMRQLKMRLAQECGLQREPGLVKAVKRVALA